MNRATQPSCATALRFGQPDANVCCKSEPDCSNCPRHLMANDGSVSTRDLLLACQPALGVAKRLDELMRRCRDDRHTPTYRDLQRVKDGR